MIILKEEDIEKAIISASSLGEAIENLYRLALPEWEEIEKVEGWPKVGRPANRIIMELLAQKFGREALFQWINIGFSSLDEDSFRVSLEDIKVIYYPRCPWCGRRHPAKDHPKCAPDAHLEAAYEERFEMYE